MVLGDPGSGSTFLKYVDPEVESIRRIYGIRAAEPSELTQNDVTTLRRLEVDPESESSATSLIDAISRANTIHLACHGSVSTHDGNSPRLFLQGSLLLEDLVQARLTSGSTMVLSACSVGGNTADAPLEILGFPATLLAIGARNVIASMWPVPDNAHTVRFMNDIHLRLADGLPASKALAQATRDAIAANSPAAVWGGFSAFGV